MIYNLIKYRENITKTLITHIKIKPDGNCLYRAFAYHKFKNEDKYKSIRADIYEEAKKNKEFIKQFFWKISMMK